MELMRRWREGDADAAHGLIDIFHDDLRSLSSSILRHDRRNSLYADELVNEIVLKLVQQKRLRIEDRSHFMALSATMMRQILVDHARRRMAQKRHHHKVTLVTEHHAADEEAMDIEELHAALEQLAQVDADLADIVELRYFAGMTVEEIAEIRDCSPSTVKRRWRAARAWLLDRLS
ncbi:sigma-70 family RNA polymerase sigma factor [Parvularcula flava]|uniref:DNA-directed RNA polymerase sigma-70 factor n=1 Tax=Aquisalinus luteolus TaxID=1566827 RepID=A0A8J3A048_9PROT|nr:ECF-type sigma factor [Aquisalinus luteolus]NHK26442.1 sigma-70 family RNA polymerase sigma factor [Aquisalinus luteolus]GGH92346.1 DNA-directed RNA polymerase sigma-70 factor [Aquisalinus luteolus]